MYAIYYWSAFSGVWREYVAPTWNARAIRHATEEEAIKRMAHLANVHPRDRFKVEAV